MSLSVLSGADSEHVLARGTSAGTADAEGAAANRGLAGCADGAGRIEWSYFAQYSLWMSADLSVDEEGLVMLAQPDNRAKAIAAPGISEDFMGTPSR
jgi:hypothetical protein